MSGRQRILRVMVVLAIALATGHAVETLRVTRPVVEEGPAVASMPDLVGITPVAGVDDPSQDSCAPRLDLAAAPAAMIKLALLAPCNIGERVLIRQSGLSFTAQVGVDGTLRLDLPALEETALVTAYFEGSRFALQSVHVPDAAQYLRFAFQAPHPLSFDLRVKEAGRLYSGQGAAGPIVTLGTTQVPQPQLAQVYSAPGPDLQDIELTVEIRITPDTCSRSFAAETLLSRHGVVVRAELPVKVPLCGSAGDILVLKNLVGAPTLAVPE